MYKSSNINQQRRTKHTLRRMNACFQNVYRVLNMWFRRVSFRI